MFYKSRTVNKMEGYSTTSAPLSHEKPGRRTFMRQVYANHNVREAPIRDSPSGKNLKKR